MSNVITTALGRVQPNYRDEYNANATYNKLDYVYYNHGSFICKFNGVSGILPTNTSYWQRVADRGEQGPQGHTGGFGIPTAEISILNPGEEASVSVTASGSDTAKIFSFDFGIPVGIDYVEAQTTTIASTESASASVALVSSGDSKGLNFSFAIPRGAAGSGAVSSVDEEQPDSGTGNVVLTAVKYGSEQELSDTEKLIARTNIGAISAPSAPAYGDFLQYAGDVSNPTWVGTPINVVPSSGSAGYVLRKQASGYGWTPTYEIPSGGDTNAILCKLSNSDYDCGWSPVISSSDIDSIIAE